MMNFILDNRHFTLRGLCFWFKYSWTSSFNLLYDTASLNPRLQVKPALWHSKNSKNNAPINFSSINQLHVSFKVFFGVLFLCFSEFSSVCHFYMVLNLCNHISPTFSIVIICIAKCMIKWSTGPITSHAANWIFFLV